MRVRDRVTVRIRFVVNLDTVSKNDSPPRSTELMRALYIVRAALRPVEFGVISVRISAVWDSGLAR